MYRFDAEKTAGRIIEWIREWFEENGKGCSAVVGISGGKDSSVTAALCVKALGKDVSAAERLAAAPKGLMAKPSQEDVDAWRLAVGEEINRLVRIK